MTVRAFRTGSITALIAVACFSTKLMAQRADVPIELDRVTAASPDSLDQLRILREAGKLQSIDQIETLIHAPKPEQIVLPPASADKLSPAEVANFARKSIIHVGWYYLCNKCDNWHLVMGGGYVVADGGVAVSCYHIIAPNASEMREGYLVAQDASGKFHPVQNILASDMRMDSVVFRIADADALKGVALNDQVGPGDPAYLLSDPKGYVGYFSSGIVDRFFWLANAGGDLKSFKDVRSLRINVSTDWAPGSSGSPVFDEHGNVICHVSTIRTEVAVPRGAAPRPSSPGEDSPATSQPSMPKAPPAAAPGTQLVLHDGVPARAVQMMIARMNEAAQAQPPATSSTPK